MQSGFPRQVICQSPSWKVLWWLLLKGQHGSFSLPPTTGVPGVLPAISSPSTWLQVALGNLWSPSFPRNNLCCFLLSYILDTFWENNERFVNFIPQSSHWKYQMQHFSKQLLSASKVFSQGTWNWQKYHLTGVVWLDLESQFLFTTQPFCTWGSDSLSGKRCIT